MNKFIVIEGIEGAGKTEAIFFVKKLLNEVNIRNIVSVREPGGTPISEKLRNIIKYDNSLTGTTELLLIYAARMQLVEKIIKPSLLQGKWVISDRFSLSSLAYQGEESNISNNLIIKLQEILLEDFKPDLIIYLDVIPQIGLDRIKIRKKIDRIEKKSLDFFRRVRNRYLKLIRDIPNVIKINASNTKKVVQNSIKSNLYKWLYKQWQ